MSRVTTASLTREIRVVCERCREPYYYIRVVRGSTERTFWTDANRERDVEIAKERAETVASDEAAWLRVVACPHCGRLQAAMRKRIGFNAIFGVPPLIAGVVGAITIHSGNRFIVLAAGMLLFGMWAKRSFRPPVGYDETEIREEMRRRRLGEGRRSWSEMLFGG